MGSKLQTSFKRLAPPIQMPRIITVFVFRCISLGALIFTVYISLHITLHKIKINEEQLIWHFIIYIACQLATVLGMFWNDNFDDFDLKKLDTRESRLAAVKKGPAKCAYMWPGAQRLFFEKERFASHLASSNIHQGVSDIWCPSLLSCGDVVGLMCVHYAALFMSVVLICVSFIPFETSISMGLLWSVTFVLLLVSFFTFKKLELYRTLGAAAREIRKECEAIDVERGGSPKEELEWWITAILKQDESDETNEKESMAQNQSRK